LAIAACVLACGGWTTDVAPGPAKTAKSKPDTAAEQGTKPPLKAPLRLTPATTEGTVALAASLEGDATATALVLTLTQAAKFTVFTLADPYRVIVDLQDVDFKVPPAAGIAGRGLVKSFRYGLLAPGKSRIVIDLASPAAIEKSDIVALRGADTVQLRVALVPTDRDRFLGLAMTAPTQPVAAAPLAQSPASTATVNPQPGSRKAKSAKPVVVLDPGHGGLDAGTLGTAGTAEKDVVLRFARQLREKLIATGRFDVRMTREIDVFVRLDERVRMARELGCELFISLHTDSVPAQIAHLNVRGATVYTMSELTGDARAQQLAEKENLSDVVAGVELRHDEQPEVASILTDLMRRETANNSLNFTTTLLPYMKKVTGLSREPHRHAAFKVLRAPDFPSVLVELGFLSNKEDEKLLVAKGWQEQVASSVTQAVEAYFAKRQVARSPF
jgi:N-acetylmuramoyl-L-alanine amidase